MKKLFLSALVLISLSFCTKEYSREDLKTPVSYATTWAGTASNQAVTFSALNDAVSTGVFSQISSVPTGLQLVTKSAALSYVYMNKRTSSFAAKANNQVLVKSDLVASPCRKLIVTVTSADISASATGQVTVYFYDCTGAAQTWVTASAVTSYDTGWCYDPSLGIPPGSCGSGICLKIGPATADTYNGSSFTTGSVCN